MKVNITLMSTRAAPPSGGSAELSDMIPVISCTIMLIGIFSSSVKMMPIAPAVKPMMTVSALKTC